MLRSFVSTGVFAIAAVASSALAETTVTQSVSFDSILPFGTYTDNLLVKTGWTQGGNPIQFPFTAPDQITSIKMEFDSTNRFYQAEEGPTPPPGGTPANAYPAGGVPKVEINVLNPARVGIVSLSKASPSATLFLYADPQDRFNITRGLLTSGANGAGPGNLGVRLGGFVSFYDNVTNNAVSSDDFTFGGASTFTVSVTGNPVPEPTALAGVALVSSLLLRRRRRA